MTTSATCSSGATCRARSLEEQQQQQEEGQEQEEEESVGNFSLDELLPDRAARPGA